MLNDTLPQQTECSKNSAAKAKASALIKEEHVFDSLKLVSTSDHILASQCSHELSAGESASAGCQVCEYNTQLNLPQLPEMIYPNNSLSVSCIHNEGCSIRFNALEALKMVDTNNLPGIQVAPSTVWQQARESMGLLNKPARPFDWTFTSEYQGTVEGLQAEPTEERIDMERLKSREPIHFYSQIMLYEDELADHGCSQMSVRVRVMPTFFFLLARFYLRVDGVLVRVCDTRVFGERGSSIILREWTKREASFAVLGPQALENVLDPNAVWQYLPVIKSVGTKLYLPKAGQMPPPETTFQ